MDFHLDPVPESGFNHRESTPQVSDTLVVNFGSLPVTIGRVGALLGDRKIFESAQLTVI